MRKVFVCRQPFDDRPAEALPPDLHATLVASLREWLPADARRAYRAMIQADPAGWHLHPHFTEGSIVEHFFAGNGITAKSLGVATLEPLWKCILAEAVAED